jgi:alanine-glyoxylate transaminase/serine-glyoxylate transaminase/serine-pyruvate transaminase
MTNAFFPTEKLLLGPGPSNVSSRVLAALGMPPLGHLDPDFIELMEDVKVLLRQVFGTNNEVTFPVSGTGSAGMEFTLVNWIEPGDNVLVAINGVFGTRLANLADRLGAQTTRLEFPWGDVIDKNQLAQKADEIKPKIICVVNGETSTGVYQPMEGLAEIAHDNGALLLADCVTSLGGMPVNLDAWGVDLAYSGTQKCLSCPPGLAPVSVSPRALEVFHQRKTPVPSFYLDLGEILKYVGTGQKRAYHHTAPVNMIFGLHAALCEVMEEGIPARIERHRQAAARLITKVLPLGFEPVVEAENRLHPLTTLRLPEGADEAALRSALLNKHQVEVGGGLGPFAGTVWRCGLMGVNATIRNADTLASCIADVM